MFEVVERKDIYAGGRKTWAQHQCTSASPTGLCCISVLLQKHMMNVAKCHRIYVIASLYL